MSRSEAFSPPVALRHAHVQTLLGTRGRLRWAERRAGPLLAASERYLVPCSDGIQLEAWIARQHEPAPTVILIHGWLGHAGSSYMLSAGAQLWRAGFSVMRLNLRDHGETAHLNEELYNAALVEEVVDAVSHLQNRVATGPAGLAGFSLGGNFALRVAQRTGIATFAVCPAIDPRETMQRIDAGWVGYRLFFVAKWHNALRRKQRAFPQRYEFEQALTLRSVGALTDLFVERHTEFVTTDDYFDRYTLTGDALRHCNARIVFARDDPVIPAEHFAGLPDTLEVTASDHGGHCAFVHSLAQPSWIDTELARHFARTLAPDTRSQLQV